LVSCEAIQDLSERNPKWVSDTDRIRWHTLRESKGDDGIGEVVFVNCELIRVPANERHDR
jgi:hypothetical protein